MEMREISAKSWATIAQALYDKAIDKRQEIAVVELRIVDLCDQITTLEKQKIDMVDDAVQIESDFDKAMENANIAEQREKAPAVPNEVPKPSARTLFPEGIAPSHSHETSIKVEIPTIDEAFSEIKWWGKKGEMLQAPGETISDKGKVMNAVSVHRTTWEHQAGLILFLEYLKGDQYKHCSEINKTLEIRWKDHFKPRKHSENAHHQALSKFVKAGIVERHPDGGKYRLTPYGYAYFIKRLGYIVTGNHVVDPLYDKYYGPKHPMSKKYKKPGVVNAKTV